MITSSISAEPDELALLPALVDWVIPTVQSIVMLTLFVLSSAFFCSALD